MDINVEKFIKDYKRMCDSYTNCDECGLLMYDCYNINSLDKVAPVVLEWAEKHPIKTYLMDFREKFPKAIEENIVWGCCCRTIYEGESCSYSNCVGCWNREMEE